MPRLLVKIFLGTALTVAVIILASTACGLGRGPDYETEEDMITPKEYGDELITYGGFDDTANWAFYLKSDSPELAQGSGAVVDGQYVMQMTQLSQSGTIEGWHGALTYTGEIPLIQGVEYEVSFNAKASDTAPLSAVLRRNGDPWTYYGGISVELTTEMLQYRGHMMVSATDGSAALIFGIGDHLETVTIDNVSVRQILNY